MDRQEFQLSESAVAGVFAWLALAALGALGLARMADRLGRRRVLMWTTVGMPACALGAAMSARLVPFVAFEIVLSAFAGAAAASSIVMIAETLPIVRRAEGQSMGGLANASGAGICVVLMPVLVHFGWSWRWLLAIAAAGLLMLPTIMRAIPESERWTRQTRAAGETRTRFYDVFAPLYRTRSITLLVCSVLAALSIEGVSAYSYFHAVSVVGLSADAASALTLVGGGVGMFGFPLGAWAAERFGRVPTIVVCGAATSSLALVYFWGPPAHYAHPALWLAVAFMITQASTNATAVASNAAVTELFPTALRGTIIGWFSLTGASGALAAESTIAILARRMGGLSVVTGWLSLLGVPSAILFGLVIEETRGLPLDQAAREDAFRAGSRSGD